MTTPPAHNEQHRLWNGPSGSAWVELQALLDRLLQPFSDRLVAAVSAEAARTVLDVGCGTGGTTIAIAQALGVGGQAVGIDISAPMLALAQSRADLARARARFILANAESYAFEPLVADMIVSRFGVMFFDDPMRAFGNLRRAAATGAPLRFIAWRSAADNPFMTVAERAASPLMALPPRQPDGPGQFAFADATRVRSILGSSGWADIEVRPIDVACTMSTDDLDVYATRMGPVGAGLAEADAATRSRVGEALRAAFAPFVDGDAVHFSAACWEVSASAQPA
jgi:SAM-dependent methyltransferase